MRESLLGKLVMVISRATPEELAAIYQFATGKSPDSAECGVQSGEAEMGLRGDETTDYKTTDHRTALEMLKR